MKLRLIALLILSTITLSFSARASSIDDLQNEMARRGLSPEDINNAIKNKFPNSDFPYYESANGCSTPTYLITLTQSSNRWFRKACNNHDNCYSTLAKPKNTCDRIFQEEMLKQCETINNLECSTTAEIYYEAVRDKSEAQEAYDTAQDKQAAYIKSIHDWLSSPKFYTNSFVSTGLLVKPGDEIRIQASGIIRFGLFAGSGSPRGILFNPNYNYFRNIPHGYLMARIYQPGMQDLEGWVPVGEGWKQLKKIQLKAPGVLEFLVNDNYPEDNNEEFHIEVTINSEK